MQQHATYDTYNPPEESAEGRAEARSGSFGTTCIHMHEFPRCPPWPRRSHRRGGRPRRPWRADKADCSFIITNIVSGSSSWASTRRRRRRGRGGAWQGTYYLLTAKGVPVDPVKVNPPPPPAPGRRAAWDLLELPAHSNRPLRGHSGWDGSLCACKHRGHRRDGGRGLLRATRRRPELATCSS